MKYANFYLLLSHYAGFKPQTALAFAYCQLCVILSEALSAFAQLK